MPIAQLKNYDCNYLYQDFGRAATLVFANSLGTDLTMWDENIEELSLHFNILRHDMRGHGKSTIRQDQITVSELGSDVLELMDFLHLDKVTYCGLSIGGLIGQWLGIHSSDRFNKIVLCNTAAKIGTEAGWNARIQQVKDHGLSSILGGTAERWFTADYRETYPNKVQEILDVFVQNSLQGYIAGCTAVRDADFTQCLSKLDVPVLIIDGTADEVTTIEDATFLQTQIPHAHLVTLPAAHLSNKEDPKRFSNYLI